MVTWRIDRYELQRWTGVGLMLLYSAVHMAEVGRGFLAHWALGLSFTVSVACALLAALGIGCDVRNVGWRLGFLVSGGSLATYLLAQTAGLPGVPMRAWGNPAALLALLVEVVFIAVFVWAAQTPEWQERTAENLALLQDE